MSQETRKLKIIEEMHAEEKTVQGMEDWLINLGKHQQYALEQTFGKNVAPRKTCGQLVSFYRAMDQSFNLGLFNEVFSLRIACERFEKGIRLSLEDVDDRHLIRPRIERFFKRNPIPAVTDDLRGKNPVLFDVRLKTDGLCRNYDTLLITSGGVVFLETRNPDRNSFMYNDGDYTVYHFQEARIQANRLLEKLKADKKILSDVLQEHDVEEVPIIPVVVFTGKLVYSDLGDGIVSIRDNQLGDFLKDICSEKSLDEETQVRIRKILSEYKVDVTKTSYPSDTDFIEAYADLRSKVESKILLASVDDEPADEEEGK